MANNLMTKTANLTPRQREIYEFVKDNIMNRGYGPTVREIGDEFGIKSPNGVMCHLKALEKKGLITREPNLSRAIQLNDKPQRKTAVDLRGQFGQGTKYKELKEIEQIDFMDLLGSGDHFCYRATDDSMADEHIVKGDFMLCRMQQFYRDGDRVIAVTDNKETHYKRFYQDGERIRLDSINGPKKSMFTNDVKILGMVVGVVRKIT
ncbi:MAG: transcriptional repressor LexA [Planctomycetaceae bacterium]